MLGFTASSKSNLAAVWLAGLLDLPLNLPLVFVRDWSLLPFARQPQYCSPGPSPLAGQVPSSVPCCSSGNASCF